MKFLRMSYCDSDMSIVLCMSFIMHCQLFGLCTPWKHTFSVRLSWNLVGMFVLIKSRTSLKLGCVRSKTRSLGQISEKPYVHSRGHIFSLIIMKLGQNVCLYEISDRFENGLCWVKTRSLVQILEKPCVCSRSHIFCLIIMKLGQNVCLDEISYVFENGSGQVIN